MNDESRLPTGPLTDLQATRLDYARRELGNARAADLHQLPPSGLILLITQLTHRLDDTLAVMDEVLDSCRSGCAEPPK